MSKCLYRNRLDVLGRAWLALVVVLAAAGRLAASEPPGSAWPMYRGEPSLAGVAGGEIPANPSLLWTFKTEGPVKSSAAIVDGKVFIGSGDSRLYALDLKTGQKLWSFSCEAEVDSSPLVLEGKVYVGSTDGNLYALETDTGKLLWKFATEDKIIGAPNYVKAPQGDAYWILAGSYDYRLYCLDAGTGKSNWVYESGNYINGTPAVSDGVTAFGGCDALLHIISLANGEQVKEVEAGAYIIGSVALAGQRAYVGHYENEFICVDLKEGTVVWRYRDRNFPYESSPALTGDRVVFGGNDKRVHCLRRDTGEKIWVFATRGKVTSSPVICDGKVVVGSDDGRLYLIGLEKGEELWSYEIGQAIKGSPALAQRRIVIGAEDGNVYAFGPSSLAENNQP